MKLHKYRQFSYKFKHLIPFDTYNVQFQIERFKYEERKREIDLRYRIYQLTINFRRQSSHPYHTTISTFRHTSPEYFTWIINTKNTRESINRSYRLTDQPDRLSGDPHRTRIRSGVFGTRLIRLAVAPSGPSRSPNGTPCRQPGLLPIHNPDHDRAGPLCGGGNIYGKVCSREDVTFLQTSTE